MMGPRILRGRMPRALALAASASLVELGPIVALLHAGAGLAAILVAGLAYQVGNALPRPAKLTSSLPLAVTAATGTIALVYGTTGSPIWFAAIAALSWTLQAVRRRLTGTVGDDLPSTVEKRTARVIGFVAASQLPTIAWLCIVGTALAAAMISRGNTAARAPEAHIEKPSAIELAMVLHQAHYFSYCYAIPMLVAHVALGGVPMVGLWFACGWISYLSAETMWRRFPARIVFVVGHTSLIIVLALLAVLSGMPWAIVTLWILSGFGGGTVYCLTLFHKASGLPHARLERAEDIGHVVGVAVALAGVTLLNWSIVWLPAVGSIWAAFAVATMIVVFLVPHNTSARPYRTSNGGAHARERD